MNTTSKADSMFRNWERKQRDWRMSSREYKAWKARQTQFFAGRLSHTSGVDRIIQADALLCILEDRPIEFDIRTRGEINQQIEAALDEGRQILRRRGDQR